MVLELFMVHLRHIDEKHRCLGLNLGSVGLFCSWITRRKRGKLRLKFESKFNVFSRIVELLKSSFPKNWATLISEIDGEMLAFLYAFT
jgi:hypothetical protein